MGLKLKQQESETLKFKSTLADLVKTTKKEIMQCSKKWIQIHASFSC